MSADEVLETLVREGITVRVEGDALYLGPAERTTPDLLAAVKAVKPVLLERLKPPDAWAVAARVRVFRRNGQPWVLRTPVVLERGVCFACGDPLRDVLFGRCAACSEALWRIVMDEDVAPWPGRPH